MIWNKWNKNNKAKKINIKSNSMKSFNQSVEWIKNGKKQLIKFNRIEKCYKVKWNELGWNELWYRIKT